MRHRLIALIALPFALPLAACGGQDTPDERALPPSADADAPNAGYVEAMRTMTDVERNGTLIRAIRDAERDCQQVTSSRERAAIGGAPAWEATCLNDVTWIVIVNDTGIAQVTNEAELAAAGIEI